MKGTNYMSYFDEINTAFTENSKDFDKKMSFIGAFMEMVADEYKCSKESADLKFISESVEDEEFAYGNLGAAYTEATEKFSEKITKVFDKLVEVFKEFCDKTVETIRLKYMGATFNARVEKISKKVKENPFIGKQKIKIFSVDDFHGASDAICTVATKFALKVDKEAAGGPFYKEFIRCYEYQIEMFKQIKVGKNTSEVTVSEAVSMLALAGKERIKEIEGFRKEQMKIIERLKRISNLSTDSDLAKDAKDVGAKLTSILKETISLQIASYNDIFRQCEKVISDANKNNKSADEQRKEEKSVEESAQMVDPISEKIGFDY